MIKGEELRVQMFRKYREHIDAIEIEFTAKDFKLYKVREALLEADKYMYNELLSEIVLFTPRHILNEFCKIAGVSMNDVTGKSRKASVILVRHAYVYFMRKNTKISQQEVGRVVGIKHSNVNIIENRVVPNDPKRFEELLNKAKEIIL